MKHNFTYLVWFGNDHARERSLEQQMTPPSPAEDLIGCAIGGRSVGLQEKEMGVARKSQETPRKHTTVYLESPRGDSTARTQMQMHAVVLFVYCTPRQPGAAHAS